MQAFRTIAGALIGALVVVVTLFSFAHVSYAQGAPGTPPGAATPSEPSVVDDALMVGSAAYCALNPTNQACTAVVGAAVEAAGGAAVEAVVEPVAEGLVTIIGEIIVKISTWFLGIAGVLLNFAIVKTVFEFSTLIGNSPGLLTAWGILRDIANMALLFGFIFLGLATILDLKKFSGSEAKKAIPRLLIFAVLMNFSLFGAQAVIDVSNALSSAMYNQADTSTCNEASSSTEGTVSFDGTDQALESLERCASATNVGLAGNFIVAAGLGGMFNFFQDTGTSFGTASLGTVFVVYVGLALFTIIAALVLLAAAIMLIIRAVVLTFLMVVAPLGFAALAIPQLNKVGEDWWNRLIHQSFFAPILLLFILVSLKITEGIGGIEAGGLAAVLTRPDSSVIGAVLVFAIVIGFLVASLIAAKKFGAMGADFATKTAGRFALGGVGVLGRQSLGRGSGAIGRAIGNSRMAETKWGRRFKTVADRGAAASYDLRGVSAVQKQLGKQGLSLGDAQKGGFSASVKAKKEKEVAYANTIGAGWESKRSFGIRIGRLVEALEKQNKLIQERQEAEATADRKFNQAQDEANVAGSTLAGIQAQLALDPKNAALSLEEKKAKIIFDSKTQAQAGAEKALTAATNELAKERKKQAEMAQELQTQREKGPSWVKEGDARKEAYAENLAAKLPKPIINQETGKVTLTNSPKRVLNPRFAFTPIFNGTELLGSEQAAAEIRKSIKAAAKKQSAKTIREALNTIAPEEGASVS